MALDQQAITVNTPTAGSIIAIIIALFALMYSAYNSGSELAYFSLSKEDIDSIDDESKQERIKQLLSKPERLLATILIGNNSVNVLIAVVLNYAMNTIFTFNSAVANFVVQTVILTFLILLSAKSYPSSMPAATTCSLPRWRPPD